MIQFSMEPIRAEAVIASASEAIHCHRAKKEKIGLLRRFDAKMGAGRKCRRRTYAQ
jgi:hypothetical protein